MEENEKVELVENKKDEDPVYITPKKVDLFANLAGIISWIVLVGFLAHTAIEVVYLREQLVSGNLVFSELIKEASFISYLFVNILTPFFTGLGIFGILQGVAAGLNMLLEMDFNAREPKG